MKCINWGIIAPGHIANKMAEAMFKSKSNLNLNINLYAVASRDINKLKSSVKNGISKNITVHTKN